MHMHSDSKEEFIVSAQNAHCCRIMYTDFDARTAFARPEYKHLSGGIVQLLAGQPHHDLDPPNSEPNQLEPPVLIFCAS